MVCGFDMIRKIRIKDGKFYSFLLDEGVPRIIDYTFLDREPTDPTDPTCKILKFDKVKEKKIINSTHELSEVFKGLISDAQELLRDDTLYCSDKILSSSEEPIRNQLKAFFDIDSRDMKSLINQLVIDVLYDKYRDDTEMTLNEYCNRYFYSLDEGKWKKFDDFDIIENYTEPIYKAKANAYKIMERRIQANVKTMSKPSKQEELRASFLFDDLYIEFIKEKHVKKPKWVWDLIYYDYTLAAVKQYRYDLGNNEKDIINELQDYDKFVEDVFKPPEGDNKGYYYKSMDLYHLESISRLEFAYKLIERLAKEAIINIDNVRVSATQFSTWVSCPSVKVIDDTVVSYFVKKRNFYNPLLLIERNWLRRMDYKINEERNNPFYQSHGIFFIRAQAYELFNYHYKYVSDNYDDISAFIKENYNLLEKYLEKDKIWENIKGTAILSTKQKIYANHMQMILSTIFRKMTKDYIRTLMNSNNDNVYQGLFGIDKETFEMFLDILENEAAKLYSSGGRKPSLSVFDKFLVTIVYNRYSRTIEELASEYGVSKRQISEAIKWVDDTLSKKNISSLVFKNKNAYQELLGIDKEEFEMLLHALETEAENSYSFGGREPSRSALANLLVATIAHYRYSFTIKDIASFYGVSKRQISAAIKWAEDTISKSEEYMATDNS